MWFCPESLTLGFCVVQIMLTVYDDTVSIEFCRRILREEVLLKNIPKCDDDTGFTHHVLVTKLRRCRPKSLGMYEMYIDCNRIEFFIDDPCFNAMYGYTSRQIALGKWKEIYAERLCVSKIFFDFAEKIIYDDLYGMDENCPKVVFSKRFDEYFVVLYSPLSYIHIEVPEVFARIYPQYIWMYRIHDEEIFSPC